MPRTKKRDICALCLANKIIQWSKDPDHEPSVLDSLVRLYKISDYCSKHETTLTKGKKK